MSQESKRYEGASDELSQYSKHSYSNTKHRNQNAYDGRLISI